MQQIDTDQFLQFFSSSYIGQILCMMSQIPITIILSFYIYNNKHKYPLKQNSPYLTILCLVSYLMANVVAISARFTISSQWQNDSNICFIDRTAVRVLSNAYLFFAQLPIIIYFFKLFRVLTAHYIVLYSKEWIVAIMSSQRKMIIGCFIWCSLLVGTDAIIRIGEDNSQGESRIIYKFFCQQTNEGVPLYFSNFKICITLLLFFIQYTMSIRVSKRLNFKGQFNTQAILILTNIFLTYVLQANQISYIRELYYHILIMYSINTLLFWYYFASTQPLISPLFTQPDWQNYTFNIVMKDEQARDSLKHFFDKQNKLYLFNAFLTNMYIEFAYKQPQKQNRLLQDILTTDLFDHLDQFDSKSIQSIGVDYNINKRYKSYQIIIGQLNQKCQVVYQLWKKTQVIEYLQHRWAKNQTIVNIMDRLNISIAN